MPHWIPPADRLIVALDTDDVDHARVLARQLDGVAGVLKIGMGLYFQQDASRFLDELIGAGRQVFLDAKVYDIPKTVRGAVASAADRGFHMMTVHAEPDIMAAAVSGRRGGMILLGVTVLTSVDQAALARMGHDGTVEALVERRVKAAELATMDGFIASAADNPDRIRRRCGAEHLLAVTPGIRPAGSPGDDQARTATPRLAIMNGADYLVVGRPITSAPDPAAAARAIIAEISETSPAA